MDINLCEECCMIVKACVAAIKLMMSILIVTLCRSLGYAVKKEWEEKIFKFHYIVGILEMGVRRVVSPQHFVHLYESNDCYCLESVSH